MHRFLPSFTAICLLLTSTLHAQVVTITPSFANQTDMVTITFDASQGNGALNGVSQVYAHTGVITNFSSSPTDWQHVQGTWGTPDPIVQMTNIGNNRHQIQYQIDNFYGVSGGEVVEALAFVFRNADGSLVGRSSDGSDIFVPLFNGDFGARITSPEEDPLFVELTDTIHFSGETSDSATIKLYHEDSLLMQVNGSSLAADIPVAPFGAGKFWLRMVAERDTHVVVDSIYYLVRAPVALGIPPAGIEDGINYVDGSTVILQLYAPNKDFIYVIGDFNNWEADPQYYMNKHISLPIYWLEITGLTPGEEYAFQYMIDDELMRVADVHADKILDPWNDGFISATTYPNLKPYPAGKTSNIVSILQTEQVPYPWDTTFTYTRPDQENLVVYELLIRDFVDESTYQTLIDTLAYFERLGINAIELMPVNEFEGNDSWGYNPDFYFAPDKYYGTEEKFKEFIEECHRRGIAVIMDIALNHSFGLSPQVRMYFDPTAGPFGEPTANSPWFNPTARHDFNVGYDYNHESDRTRDFVDRVLAYWVEEYQIDGYRLDLSKGFTQNNTLGNIGAWNALDQSRINNLTRIANELWADHPGTYMILEHFADNSEETVLADAGFLLWGNGNHEYTEGALGFSSNMNWQSYQERGWQDAHVVS
ncbi:MAG: alpha-amylase family glycosyl hydrolase, partial [Bacteroidota bacterium]